jgi:hypothetical protein
MNPPQPEQVNDFRGMVWRMWRLWRFPRSNFDGSKDCPLAMTGNVVAALRKEFPATYAIGRSFEIFSQVFRQGYPRWVLGGLRAPQFPVLRPGKLAQHPK